MKIPYKLIVLIVIISLSSYIVYEYYEYNSNNAQYVVQEENIETLLMQGYTGEGITVAILDTGLNEGIVNPNSLGKWTYYNATDGTDNIVDTHSHGTWITCVMICSNEDLDTGLIPNANFVIIKVYDEFNRILPEYIVAGIEFAIDQQVDIINLSHSTQTDYSDIERVINEANDLGIIVLAPNDESEIVYPATYDNVISVGMDIDSKAKVIIYSNTYNLEVFSSEIYEYIDEPSASISCAIATSYIVMILEKCEKENIEFTIELLEGMGQ